MTAYYNEIDPFAAAWLRELIKAGHIAPGTVDERSIEDVRPEELKQFTQCHFFAGIGVWSYALRQAGWPDDKPVWTGSCPCQPFSAAGKRGGFSDERHLWPAFHWLIEQCRPAVVFGEQVASKATEPWIDLVQADVERMGYAFGCVAFPSAGVGAPHIRDRLFWVANTNDRGEYTLLRGGPNNPAENLRGGAPSRPLGQVAAGDKSEFKGVYGPVARSAGPTNGFWGTADWLFCRDGKWRAVEPGSFPLAHGAPARVVRLRAYGNAINAEAAKEFIASYMGV